MGELCSQVPDALCLSLAACSQRKRLDYDSAWPGGLQIVQCVSDVSLRIELFTGLVVYSLFFRSLIS